jgi:hypothetical protein
MIKAHRRYYRNAIKWPPDLLNITVTRKKVAGINVAFCPSFYFG